MTRRFDRNGTKRIPYQSFKTMFQMGEMEHSDYSTLAREVARISSDPEADGQELFARAAFNVMVSNIDDHMKNHGLLRTAPGWRLAPSFDVNPARRGFSDTPLTPEDDPANPDLRLLIAHAEDFHFTRAKAAQRLGQIALAVEAWTDHARTIGIENDESDSMEVTFEESYRHLAYELAAG